MSGANGDDRHAPGPMMFDPSQPPRAAERTPAPMAIDPAEVVAVVPDPPRERHDSALAVEDSAAAVPSAADDATAGTPWGVRRPDWALRLFLATAVGVVLVGVGFDTADTIGRAFAFSRVLGWGVVGLCAGAAAGLTGLLIGELRGLARLRRLETLRARSSRAEETGGAAALSAAVVRLYADRPDMGTAIARLREALPDAHDDARAMRLLEREVLAPLDARAYRLTVLAARDTALATALVPAAIIDMLIVTWRNLKLVRSVAALYGTRPGYWASLRLLRRMLGNLAVAGVGESVHDAAVTALGGSLAGAVSASLGKGLVNGLLTARVGIAAMHACRPVAFTPETRPSLARARGELLGLSRDLF